MSFSRKILLLFCLIGMGLLGPSSQVEAKAGDIFIDPQDFTLIRRATGANESEVLLRAADLPSESVLHPIRFGSQKFTYLAVNPDKTILAFSAQAGDHEWSGLYYLANKDIRQLNLRFESKSLEPYWSQDSRYLIFEEADSNRRRFLEVFDLEGDSHCVLDGKTAKNKFLNILQPWWSDSGDKIFFKAQINNYYRKSLGLKPQKMSGLIGEASPKCQKVVLRSGTKFMAELAPESMPDEARVLISPEKSPEPDLP